ncbi:hypothetical protein [Pelagerythrobacter sp.]|uniref:hypothetical protein n=1 Tax=Pelagerythrobacter sp. TaxID=2800702 RepID=UPI0035B2FA1E
MKWFVCGWMSFLIFGIAPAAGQITPLNGTPPAEERAITPGGVDIRTGQYAYRHVDIVIGSGSPTGGISLERTMGSTVSGHIKPFAKFTHNWEIMLTEKRVGIFNNNYNRNSGQDFRINVHYGDLSETFDSRQNQSNFSQISRGGHAKLTYIGDRTSNNVVYTLTASDGTRVKFRPLRFGECSFSDRCAYASEITSPEGTVYKLSYQTGGPSGSDTRLRNVVSSDGYALLFEYGSAWSSITKACAINLAVTVMPVNGVCPSNNALTAVYVYGSGGLTSVTDPTGAVWRFTYSGTGTMGFINPGSTTPWLINSIGGSVSSDHIVQDIILHQQFADGRSYTYNYSRTPYVRGDGDVPPPQSVAGGTVTDQAGRTFSVEYSFPIHPESRRDPNTLPNIGDANFQTTPGPTKIVDQLGRTYESSYCDRQAPVTYPGECWVTTLQWSENPEGDRTDYYIDGYYYNVHKIVEHTKPGTSLPDLVQEAGYATGSPVTSAKPSLLIDGRGNRTHITYDPTHGGMLTVTQPANETGIRSQTRYYYGQRYAWIKNASGGYSRAATPIWVLTSEEYCKTSAASGTGCSSGAGDEVVTTYDYGPDSGPNNLFVRGVSVTANGQTRRTCYGYDRYGRKISEATPTANLVSCS